MRRGGGVEKTTTTRKAKVVSGFGAGVVMCPYSLLTHTYITTRRIAVKTATPRRQGPPRAMRIPHAPRTVSDTRVCRARRSRAYVRAVRETPLTRAQLSLRALPPPGHGRGAMQRIAKPMHYAVLHGRAVQAAMCGVDTTRAACACPWLGA